MSTSSRKAMYSECYIKYNKSNSIEVRVIRYERERDMSTINANSQ